MMARCIAGTIKGRDRETNQDTCSTLTVGNTMVMFVADGATNSYKSGEFMYAFCECTLRQLSAMNNSVTREDIESSLASAHAEVRLSFPAAKGSYLLLVIDPSQNQQMCFYKGDCRVGLVEETQICWLNFPENIPYAEGITEEELLCSSPDRHTLYKCLKSRRYEEPSYLELNLDLNKPIILATDGFWSKHPATLPPFINESNVQQHIMNLNCGDDATAIIRVANYTNEQCQT